MNFALFMGIAMSVTAFPVLARILAERGLSKTVLGSTALSCAAVNDVTAWSILALVVAIVGSVGVRARRAHGLRTPYSSIDATTYSSSSSSGPWRAQVTTRN